MLDTPNAPALIGARALSVVPDAIDAGPGAWLAKVRCATIGLAREFVFFDWTA